MTRKVWLPIGIFAGVLICALAVLYMFSDIFSPMYALSADVDITVSGDISAAEEELCGVIREFNHKAGDVELVNMDSLVDSDGSEYVRAAFNFSQPENLYERIWKKAAGKELEGVAHMLISTGGSEAVIYRISCNYGYIDRE